MVKFYLNCKGNNSSDTRVNHLLVENLKKMLDQINSLVQSFWMTRDIYKENNIIDVKFQLISSRSKGGHNYNIPTYSEVVACIVGDIDSIRWDIVIESKSSQVQHISELHPLYLAL